jgi:2-polyprenyl-6-methoxyphenol hydroxylase-like FAD-dependent oxidoreductase
LALSEHKIPVKLYESRHPDSEVLKSGIVLTPNGIWVLDKLGIFNRIKDECYKARYRVFKNASDETTKKTLTADENRYGYCNHRTWRKVILEEMRKMLAERSVDIHFDSKFNGIVSDDAEGVKFRINDETLDASMLIGSDGVHSTVRQYIAPGIGPEYTGIIGVLSHIKRSAVEWPYEGYERNATIQDKPGAIFFIPEDAEAEDIMIGRQIQYPEQSREDLEKLQTDYDKLISFYRQDYDQWGTTARKIIDAITANKETCYIWPFVRMPTLPQWFSSTGCVIIIGDGAHAIPPSSAQGLCQALEDAYSLTLLLTAILPLRTEANGATTSGHVFNGSILLKGLASWQEMRQKRIDEIYDYATNSTNVARMSESERQKLIAEGKIKQTSGEQEDMGWLYCPKLEGEMKERLDNLA